MTATASRYQSRITQEPTGLFFAVVVRVDRDGSEHVIHGYRGRHFKTRAAAERSTARHIATF